MKCSRTDIDEVLHGEHCTPCKAGKDGAAGKDGQDGTDVARTYLTMKNNQLEINVSQVNIIGNLDIHQNMHVHGDWHVDGDEVQSIH